jgi:sensor c-di-GMP phosphodiesterase-like protein
MPLFRTSRRKPLLTIALLCVGALLGAWMGKWIGSGVDRRSAQAELQRYADKLSENGNQLGMETDAAVNDVVHDHLPLCSDAELALMRNFVYNAAHVRDLGRTRDGKLYCSTGIGRVAKPIPLVAADLDAGGMRVIAFSRLLISRESKGFIIGIHDVSVVLNPAIYKSLDDPPMTQGGWLHVRGTLQLVHSFGEAMPLSDAEILSDRELRKGGTIYLPRCSPSSLICVVAAEPEAAMKHRPGGVSTYFCVTGALLGGLIAAVALLLFRTYHSMENQLRRAVESGSLTLQYQPVVELTTGRVVSAEVLARWVDEDGDRVRPDIFIALAEEKGFITGITRHIVATALGEMRDILAAGGFSVSVNVAAQDLQDPEFAAFLQRHLSANALVPSALGIELTERSTANHPLSIAAIDRLKATGYAVYLDDFGTGFSSLSYLHELAIDAIKIDRTFTQTIGTEAVTASVVPQILAIARELDLIVVVEGIERQDQADYFAASDVRILGQGFYFGHPMSASELRQLLREQAP